MPETKKRTPISNDNKRNPQITDVTIGIRSLRSLTLYPLSMADQFELTDLIVEAFQAFYVKETRSESEFIFFIIELIKKNLGRVLELITDEQESKKVLKEISNDQAIEIAKSIYDTNFGGIEKNVKSLTEKIQTIVSTLPSGRQSPQSVNTTQDTDSKTSTEKAGDKEEQPTDN